MLTTTQNSRVEAAMTATALVRVCANLKPGFACLQEQGWNIDPRHEGPFQTET